METIQEVFTVGADDYISKPILEPVLVARILNRLERERYRQQMAEIDTLTRVTNRRKSLQKLNQLLNLAKRKEQSFCFIILDLDNFQQVNDQYGHNAGDRVLKCLGDMLKQEFRSEDVIARWGGEEFIIGLYDMTKVHSLKRLTKFLETFYSHKFTTVELQTFQVSFSSGIAEYPLDGNNLEQLYHAADAALSQAKAKGKNRVTMYKKINNN